MIGLRVTYNDKEKKTGVIDVEGHISANVFLDRLNLTDDDSLQDEVRLHFGGCPYGQEITDERRSFTWMSKTLKVGDRIVIDVVEVVKGNKPRIKIDVPVTPEYIEAQERRRYAELKAKYEPVQAGGRLDQNIEDVAAALDLAQLVSQLDA